MAKGGTFLLQDGIGPEKAELAPQVPGGCKDWVLACAGLAAPASQAESDGAPMQARMKFMQALSIICPLSSSRKLMPHSKKLDQKMKPASLASGSHCFAKGARSYW